MRRLSAQGEGALRGLVVSARRAFVSALEPTRMPAGWHVEHGGRAKREEEHGEDNLGRVHEKEGFTGGESEEVLSRSTQADTRVAEGM